MKHINTLVGQHAVLFNCNSGGTCIVTSLLSRVRGRAIIQHHIMRQASSHIVTYRQFLLYEKMVTRTFAHIHTTHIYIRVYDSCK
jgi:hypothetical protein